MTGRADICDRRDAGRNGTMAAVTSRTGRRAEVASLHQSSVVNAVDVSGKLVGRNAVRLHVIGI